ncbi:MAG: leucyl aminopeptidase [Luteitalea sp.]|nr:leucyl aminopeptidase [Luteitalea sp.]
MASQTRLSLSVTGATPRLVTTDLIVLPVFVDDAGADLAQWNDASGGELARLRGNQEIRGKLYETHWLHVDDANWRCRRVLVMGAGPRNQLTLERTRRLATAAGLLARRQRIGRLALVQRGPLDRQACAQALAEGLVLASFQTDPYKTRERDQGALREAAIIADGEEKSVTAAAERGVVLGEATNLARGLSNEPSNLLTPRSFAERAHELLANRGLAIDVLDESRIQELGMGLMAGVSRGSVEPPCVLVVRYTPPETVSDAVLGLVGKGVTFDTGGVSIKPADGMDKMKHDMAGGASVLAALHAVAQLQPPVSVVGVIPATENMVGGRAIKPGDVLRSATGKTVEVLNTDAEGRLILADALWYARELGATHLVDVATLTGACVVALGRTTSGLFGQPASWVELVRETGEHAGDRLWPMPLFEDYTELLESEIADLQNIGGRAAGAITAAAFLKEFTGGLPWAHLDIAGTAWADDATPYQPKGATGVAVRTLAELTLTSGRFPATT